MQILFVLVFLLLPCQVMAIPDCYNNAEMPAHGFPFAPADKLQEVIGLSQDGKACVKIPFINGEPVVRQQIYVPFGQLYESYARAISENNGNAAKKLFTFVRPTPRPFPLWAWLYDEPQSAPMPWGTETMAKMINLLSPEKSLTDHLLSKDSNGLPVVFLERAWPALFLLMGGEIIPSEEWAKLKSSGQELPKLYSWRFPYITTESIKQSGKTWNVRGK